MPKRIPITTAKAVAEKHDLRQCLLIGWDGERVHVVLQARHRARVRATSPAAPHRTVAEAKREAESMLAERL